MKLYFRKLLEDRIRYLQNEIYRNNHLLTMKLPTEDRQVLKETLFKYEEELGKAKQIYFQLDEIQIYADQVSI